MPKNIIILCDGTGQIGGKGASTNVYKLFNMLEDRTPRQVIYYDPGIGTDMLGKIAQIFGIGFKKNVLECYQFLFDHYEAGDSIYLFGFSRGAATVRSLATFIEMFGVLPMSRKDLIDEAFRIYKMRTGEEDHAHLPHDDDNKKKNVREEQAEAFVKKHHTMWTRVKFLGVWDTVAALGGTGQWLSMVTDRFFPHRFHNFALGPGVDFARHAISIDDERKTFHPIVWDTLKNDPRPDRLKQVWFCGVHTDVGGGYPDKEQQLAYYSLDWMIREAKAKGLLFYENSPAWKDYLKLKQEDEKDEKALINGPMHNEQTGFIGWFYSRDVRKWNPKNGAIVLHKSVTRRIRNNRNLENPEYKSGSWIFKITDYRIEE
jgi:uncharacterized protein (DUF2235 family)